MTQSATKLSIIFFIALFADISMIFLKLENLQIFTKPSLMVILLVWFCVSARNLGSAKYLIIFALVFSCFGDVFLLFEKQNPNLFIFGLGSFLIAHFFYIGYFYQIRKLNGVDFVPKILVFLGIVIYLVSLLTLILPFVTDIKIPVIMYATTLAAMLLTSFHAFEFNKHSFGKICVAGTLIFVVSDSIISVNRFYQPLEFASIYIMLTYGIAQFLITIGAFQNLETISHELSE